MRRRFPRHLVSRHLPVLGVAAAVGVVLLANLGGYRTLSSHECLAAVPARGMSSSGDWTTPDFAGIPRVKKPPLGYWLIAACGAVFKPFGGGGVTPLTARLPSASAALLLCGLIGRWGTRWYGRRAGLAAAFVQGTSLWAVRYGRKAEVDATLALLVAAGVYLAATAPRDEPARRARWRWAAVWFLAGLGWLGKFHFAPALLFGPIVARAVALRRTDELRRLANPLGIAAFVLLAGVWPARLLARVPEAWDVWTVQTVGRAGGAFDTRPPWFYPLQAVALTAPWSHLWMWRAWRVVRRVIRRTSDGAKREGGPLRRLRGRWRAATRPGAVARRTDRDLFPVLWLASGTALLCLSVGRNRHYLLPVLPACALLAGRAAAAWGTATLRRADRWGVPRRFMRRAGWAAVAGGRGGVRRRRLPHRPSPGRRGAAGGVPAG